MVDKGLLLISYAFPPHNVVGALRPLRIAKYLGMYTDWRPYLLTVDKAFRRQDSSLAAEVPSHVPVYRTASFEPLSWWDSRFIEKDTGTFPPESAGRYKTRSSFTTCEPSGGVTSRDGLSLRCKRLLRDIVGTPDAQAFWNIPAIMKGYEIVRRHNIRLILVTAPPWSSLQAGYWLGRLTGLPWVADFRDPWIDIARGQQSALRKRVETALERLLVMNATTVISSTERYTQEFAAKYPGKDPLRFATLYNGFDEYKVTAAVPRTTDRFSIVHLGSLYPQMTPYGVFRGLQRWLATDSARRTKLELVFVGEINAWVRQVLEDLDLSDVVRVTGYIPHEKAIGFCKGADLLLLAMGVGKETPLGWVPSKTYEYLACRRPILAYTVDGEAADMIRRADAGYIVSDDDSGNVVRILDTVFAQRNRKSDASGDAYPGTLGRFEQRSLMCHLGEILDTATEHYARS